MNIIWYPGCGQDFNPVLTLLRSNPRREHVPRRGPKDDGPILWMTDYCPEDIQYFDRPKPRERLPVSPIQAYDGLVVGLRVHVKGRARRELKRDEVRIRYVRHPRRKLEGAEIAKRVSAERWVAKWRPDPIVPWRKRSLLKILKDLERANPRNEDVILAFKRQLAMFPQPQEDPQTQPPP
jgi:hypothetical protein